MAAFSDNIRSQVGTTDTLQRLILVNVAVFLFIRIGNALSGLFLNPLFTFDQITYWLAIPAHVERLGVRPWTPVTYMFLHWDFLHILFNMLWLFWMGKILQEFLGNKKLFSTYILGGLSGAIFFCIAFNIFPLFSASLPDSIALGASASVLAITVAAATLVPNYSVSLLFFGNIPLKWIAVFTILIDLINMSGNNAGGHIAHLGGAFFGFIYIKRLQKGQDLAAWFNRIFSSSDKKKTAIKVTEPKIRKDEDFNVQRKAKQERMDEILDKIGKSGYGSLTQAEKDFLFRISKEE
jgi:membrane associated rhomboid family serine protease